MKFYAICLVSTTHKVIGFYILLYRKSLCFFVEFIQQSFVHFKKKKTYTRRQKDYILYFINTTLAVLMSGQPKSDINKYSGKFNILVTDLLVAKRIQAIDATIANNIQVGEKVDVSLTFSSGFVAPVNVIAIFEKTSFNLVTMTIPQVEGINDATSPMHITSLESIPSVLMPVLNPAESKFTPFFEIIPGPITFINASIISILPSGQIDYGMQFGSFSGASNVVGFKAMTYQYNI